MSITPIDSIRRAIARRNGVADPTVSDGAHGQGGRIENGLFPASHTAEELARIQELSQRNAGGPDSSQATRRRRERDRQPGPIHRMVNAWWNRLLGAVYGGGFSTQEAEYEDHATRRDYLWNTLGTAVWGMAFPLLTIVSTQLVGTEEAGKFSIAFVTGTLIMIACNYGVRNFPGLGHRRKDLLCLLPAQPLDSAERSRWHAAWYTATPAATMRRWPRSAWASTSIR